jgi:RNA polymerase sigma-70 factor (ECF subfamily)
VTSRPPAVEAFERFFLAEHPKLVALGLAWTGDGETARELAQETLVRAHREWARVGDLDIPGAWVRRVMINLLTDDHRSKARDRRLTERLDQAGSVEAPTVSDDRWWNAVRALPDRERAAVTLHYLEELSINEVADVLEVAPGTVKASLSHARQKLRITLSDTKDPS